jgi:hypothetical protein
MPECQSFLFPLLRKKHIRWPGLLRNRWPTLVRNHWPTLLRNEWPTLVQNHWPTIVQNSHFSKDQHLLHFAATPWQRLKGENIYDRKKEKCRKRYRYRSSTWSCIWSSIRL